MATPTITPSLATPATTNISSDGSNLVNGIPVDVSFSLMLVSVCMSCFIYQSITAGMIFYKTRKPIHGIAFGQAVLAVTVSFVTLLTSLVDVDCTFRLIFSVVGINVADIALQSILLWKAYIGNNQSKVVLCTGTIPLFALFGFILVNMTVGRSYTFYLNGVCVTQYPTYIVIFKTVVDCASNAFLSLCFVLEIYRHYRVLGTSIYRTLIAEGLLYCFGVCLSNIITGVLMALQVIGGITPILYTADWCLASYLIIKQLSHGLSHRNRSDQSMDLDEVNGTNRMRRPYFPGSSARHIEQTDDEKSFASEIKLNGSRSVGSKTNEIATGVHRISDSSGPTLNNASDF